MSSFDLEKILNKDKFQREKRKLQYLKDSHIMIIKTSLVYEYFHQRAVL